MRTKPMPSGRRDLGANSPTSLLIKRASALPKHMHERTREVTQFATFPAKQGQGYGTTLMHKVCREADAANIILILQPETERLERWYAENFGFMRLQAEPIVLMARQVGSTPRMLALTPLTQAMFVEKAAQLSSALPHHTLGSALDQPHDPRDDREEKQ